jgi:hypothetical protein
MLSRIMTRQCWLATALVLGAVLAAQGAEPPVDFSRQIRPILANNCFKCHGFDAAERQAGLRLDQREAATGEAESGEHAIVPGKPEASELIKRVSSADADLRMPPPETKKSLTEAEKTLLSRWIAEGANYQTHWAFTAPVSPPLPDVQQAAWPRGELDRFILSRLEREGLAPSAEASRTTLIRRLSLDLTGFPPTIGDVEAFLVDERPDALERLVDRLMASPHHGERMAVDWLDASRFADTHGYHIDAGRDMTLWRKYVIDSFIQNVPFVRFTIEQLAGDLLPSTGDAERDLVQKLASGFNRNHMINFEGGAIPEEYLTAYIIDRVNTTGTVFLGLTVACTQCHDHKYDPLTQREFYQLYAFFNNVPEAGLDGSKGNAKPLIRVPTREQAREHEEVAAKIKEAEAAIAAAEPEIAAAQVKWEETALAKRDQQWKPLAFESAISKGGATLTQEDDKSVLASGENPATDTYELTAGGLEFVTGIRLEALPHESLKGQGPGRSDNGNIVLTNVRLLVLSADGNAPKALQLKAASANFSQKDFPVANAIDDKPGSGWGIHPELGKPHSAIFELEKRLELLPTEKLLVELSFQSIYGQHQLGRFRVSATYATNPHAAGSLPDGIAAALAAAADQRTAEQKAEIQKYYREQVSTQSRGLLAELTALKVRQEAIDKQTPTSMVMAESDKPRETFLLVRGAYDKPGEKVTPEVPSFLPPLAGDAPRNRLGLANWLVSSEHPLMARVTVNRYWQMFFGTGLVKTAEDFGTQGELPSHGELLDWLAVDFRESGVGTRESGWDVKRLVRQIVTSATYRQSAAVTPELVGKDPENRLLARGPRFRLQAEFIRDQALYVSGLYDGRIGGASVSPYQPTGLWEELMSRQDGANWTAQTYTQSHGIDLYRRTMYTFWKRTCPPPTLATFDAPDRETCTVRRSRTNTPLQALVLLNDPTYIEASRQFAERILREGGATTDERLTFAFQTVTAREPNSAEMAVLRTVYEKQLTRFRALPGAATSLLKIGESAADPQFDAAELAAWAMVASVILNIDEAITKG